MATCWKKLPCGSSFRQVATWWVLKSFDFFSLYQRAANAVFSALRVNVNSTYFCSVRWEKQKIENDPEQLFTWTHSECTQKVRLCFMSPAALWKRKISYTCWRAVPGNDIICCADFHIDAIIACFGVTFTCALSVLSVLSAGLLWRPQNCSLSEERVRFGSLFPVT